MFKYIQIWKQIHHQIIIILILMILKLHQNQKMQMKVIEFIIQYTV